VLAAISGQEHNGVQEFKPVCHSQQNVSIFLCHNKGITLGSHLIEGRDLSQKEDLRDWVWFLDRF